MIFTFMLALQIKDDWRSTMDLTPGRFKPTMKEAACDAAARRSEKMLPLRQRINTRRGSATVLRAPMLRH
jgi:hypothetical protein